MRSLPTITDLTRERNVTTRTLRFHEQEGLIEPIRRGRTRRYRPADWARPKLILRGRRLGCSLAEIRDSIAGYAAPPGERAQLEHLIARIEEKRAGLESKRRDISQTLSELGTAEAGGRERLEAKSRGNPPGGAT